MPTTIFYDAAGLIRRIVVTDTAAEMAAHLPEKDETAILLEKTQYGSFDHLSLAKSVEEITKQPPFAAPPKGEDPNILSAAQLDAATKAFNDTLGAGKSFEDAMIAGSAAAIAAISVKP